jgi:hypothetical protein
MILRFSCSSWWRTLEGRCKSALVQVPRPSVLGGVGRIVEALSPFLMATMPRKQEPPTMADSSKYD